MTTRTNLVDTVMSEFRSYGGGSDMVVDTRPPEVLVRWAAIRMAELIQERLADLQADHLAQESDAPDIRLAAGSWIDLSDVLETGWIV